MRKTKIICTIGPATQSAQMLTRLVKAGMNVARLNFSHGTAADHGRVIRALRRIAAREGRPIAVLQDLAGPKIRIGRLADGPVVLAPNQRVILTTRRGPGSEGRVPVTCPELPGSVAPGDTVLLCDGAIELRVERTSDTDVECRVVTGGSINSGKGINLPTRSIPTPILTEKDRRDLQFGLRHGVDYVALSFVRTADDIRDAREAVRAAGGDVPLVAKIEKHEALTHIDGILAAVDAIMIARGDLGVEIPIEQVPQVQKALIEKSNQAGKPVITATQMLKSMEGSPSPTRAEVTDVANAILDGTDAVMLSEETAIGQYPVRAVETMGRIAEHAETGLPYLRWRSRPGTGGAWAAPEAVARAACELAESVGATAIVTCTQSGSTTRLVAKCRPRQPILAMTPQPDTCRRLSLVWGAVPIEMASAESTDEMESRALAAARDRGGIPPGDKVVLTAGLPLRQSGTTNLIKVTAVPPGEG